MPRSFPNTVSLESDGEIERFYAFGSVGGTNLFLGIENGGSVLGSAGQLDQQPDEWWALLPSSWIGYASVNPLAADGLVQQLRYRKYTSGANAPSRVTLARQFRAGDTTHTATALRPYEFIYGNHYCQRLEPQFFAPDEFVLVANVSGSGVFSSLAYSLQWAVSKNRDALSDFVKARLT